MKIFTQPGSIRAAVKDLLSDSEDERVVAVAYVGADAFSFLSAPMGLTVYCWPQAGGTNPAAVEDLVRAGVKVHFVKRLHAKVYWSHTRGALVGFANLTANALGEEALQEAAVLVPPGLFDMHSFIGSMKPEPDFAATLKRLHEAHVRFLQRNPHREKSTVPPLPLPLPLFPQWLAGEGRAEWRLGWYEEDVKPPTDAIDGLEKETGTRKFPTFIGASRSSDLKRGVFTLSFRVREVADAVRVSALEWWAPENVVRSKTKAWKDYPYIWFARVRVPAGARPPFNVREVRFRRALATTIYESGGLNWLRKTSLRPTKGFLELLSRNYEGAGP